MSAIPSPVECQENSFIFVDDKLVKNVAMVDQSRGEVVILSLGDGDFKRTTVRGAVSFAPAPLLASH